MKKIFIFFAMLFMLTSCAVKVESIKLSKSSHEMYVGEKVILAVYITPSDATYDSIVWSSSSITVAEVSNGTVVAKNVGTAVITAKVENFSATCKITVKEKEVSSISLSEYSKTIKVGESFNINATISPSDAANKSLTWKSSNTSVATVSSNGYVYGVSAGTAVITAKSSNGIEATCTVTVKNAAITSVSLSATSKTIKVGDTFTLTASHSPSSVTGVTYSWSTSDSNVAIVSSGVVKGLKAGTCTITVTANGKTASCKVTVQDATSTKKEYTDYLAEVMAHVATYGSYSSSTNSYSYVYRSFTYSSSEYTCGFIVDMDDLTLDICLIQSGTSETTVFVTLEPYNSSVCDVWWNFESVSSEMYLFGTLTKSFTTNSLITISTFSGSASLKSTARENASLMSDLCLEFADTYLTGKFGYGIEVFGFTYY